VSARCERERAGQYFGCRPEEPSIEVLRPWYGDTVSFNHWIPHPLRLLKSITVPYCAGTSSSSERIKSAVPPSPHTAESTVR